MKSTPPTTQTVDVARCFKNRQTFCRFVFLIFSKRSPVDKVGRFRMVLQRFKRKNTQESTWTSGVRAGKRQGSWDNLLRWKSFMCSTFWLFRRKPLQSSVLFLNYFVVENKLYIWRLTFSTSQESFTVVLFGSCQPERRNFPFCTTSCGEGMCNNKQVKLKLCEQRSDGLLSSFKLFVSKLQSFSLAKDWQ